MANEMGVVIVEDTYRCVVPVVVRTMMYVLVAW